MAMEQTPCPYRIPDDMGSAFLMGAFGGGVYHAIKGMRNSPRGFVERFYGGYQSVTMRAPTLGGNFAVWGGLFATFDCGLSHLRKKEDPWNAIAAGGLTGGTLAIRSGFRLMTTNAAIGAALLALIEGLSFALNRSFNSTPTPAQQAALPSPTASSSSSLSSSSSFLPSSNSDGEFMEQGFALETPEPIMLDDYSFNGEKDFEDDSF